MVAQAAGPSYGYYPNPYKTWLVVKSEHLEAAEKMFKSTGINLIDSGKRYLEAMLGKRPAVENVNFVREQVVEWVKEVETLAVTAEFQPQAAYAVYTHCLAKSRNYIMRTIPNIDSLLQPLEDAICHVFLPALTGRWSFSEEKKELFVLPALHGGLGITIPMKHAQHQFSSPAKLSNPLVSLICAEVCSYPEATRTEQRQVKATLCSLNHTAAKQRVDGLKERPPQPQQLSMEQMGKRGASSWLTNVLVAGFILNKQGFTDALCLRYGWRPLRLPSHCLDVFSVSHPLSCSRGAFLTVTTRSGIYLHSTLRRFSPM